MKQPVHDISRPALLRAIEDNIDGFLLELGRAGGGETRNEPGLHWILGGSPLAYHNCVVRTSLQETEVDAAIEMVKSKIRMYQLPGSWHIGPSTRPLDLSKRLIEHGFTYGGDEAGMAVDLLALQEQIAPPAHFVVERVRNEQELEIWARTLGMGFGEGEKEANWVGAMYRIIGLDEQGAWHHYLARWNGEAVGTATLFLGAGVAGIYFVFTLPQARRQGIGAALTLAALRDARRRGYRIGVLGSSNMGFPIYQRLGFQQYCQLSIYEWSPQAIDGM